MSKKKKRTWASDKVEAYINTPGVVESAKERFAHLAALQAKARPVSQPSGVGHRHCWHPTAVPVIHGCCGCNASLMPGTDFEQGEKNHSLSAVDVIALHTNVQTNLDKVMEGCAALIEKGGK